VHVRCHYANPVSTVQPHSGHGRQPHGQVQGGRPRRGPGARSEQDLAPGQSTTDYPSYDNGSDYSSYGGYEGQMSEFYGYSEHDHRRPTGEPAALRKGSGKRNGKSRGPGTGNSSVHSPRKPGVGHIPLALDFEQCSYTEEVLTRVLCCVLNSCVERSWARETHIRMCVAGDTPQASHPVALSRTHPRMYVCICASLCLPFLPVRVGEPVHACMCACAGFPVCMSV
jgi:hypothetical protein